METYQKKWKAVKSIDKPRYFWRWKWRLISFYFLEK